MRSNVYRLLVSRERAPIAHHPLTITYNYKLSVRLTKMRFLTARVRLFRLQKFQKSIQRVFCEGSISDNLLLLISGVPLGSPQISICGESENIRVTTHKTEFCGDY